MRRWMVPAALVAAALAGCLSEEPSQPQTLFEDVPRDAAESEEAYVIEWKAPDEATVRPGVAMRSPSGSCTSNFVFTSPDKTSVYIGFAAHCVNEGEATDTNGCDNGNTPLDIGTEVQVEGASQPGRLIYNAWLTMQKEGEADGDTCAFNDFAVVELHPDDHGAVSPAVRHFGGPTGIAENPPALSKVISFGNSPLRPGPEELDYKEGYLLESDGKWRHTVWTATPGIPGDSGSNILLASGEALGIVVTLNGIPPGSNGVTDLGAALDYAAAKTGLVFELATWELLSSGNLPN